MARLLDLLLGTLRLPSLSPTAERRPSAESRVSIAEYPHPVDVYRSEPLERNRSSSPCFTLRLRNNYDLRDYLVMKHPLRITDLPSGAQSRAAQFQLWKENEDASRAFFFFDILFSENDEVDHLRESGFAFVRNTGGREWQDYDEYQARHR